MSIKLREEQNYKRYADTCRNCRYYRSHLTYGGVEGMTAHVCTLHGSDNEDLELLVAPWGVCDSHHRNDRK